MPADPPIPDDTVVIAPSPPGRPAGDPRESDRPADTTLWDDWDHPPRALSIPVLHLDGFDGPMDLLLDLAERQRIDLGRISFLELTEQFIAGMARLERHVALEPRHAAAGFLVSHQVALEERASLSNGPWVPVIRNYA